MRPLLPSLLSPLSLTPTPTTWKGGGVLLPVGVGLLLGSAIERARTWVNIMSCVSCYHRPKTHSSGPPTRDPPVLTPTRPITSSSYSRNSQVPRKISESLGTFSMSEYSRPIYRYLRLDHFETPRHVPDLIRDSELPSVHQIT